VGGNLLRRDPVMEKRTEIASRMSLMLNAAFSKTFEGVYGYMISVDCPNYIRAFQFMLSEDRGCLNGLRADRVPALIDFVHTEEFLENVSAIAHRHGFRCLGDLHFFDVKNNEQIMVTDSLNYA
jgi:hypothetical protein